MPTIPNAPGGEDTSIAGTEKIPLSGSKWAALTTVRDWLKTYFDTLYSTGAYPPGHLHGLTLSNNVTDPTNDIDIAVGKCRDSTDAQNIAFASGLTKQLDVVWSVGTNAGMLDTGAVGNSTYHIWLIKRSDTGVVDVLASLSASSPTMPASYDYKRRIGSIVRASAAIKAFVQDGDEFMWATPVSDLAAANPGTAAATRTLTLPIGLRVKAKLSVAGYGTSAAAVLGAIYISDLSVADVAAGGSTAFSAYDYTTAVGENLGGSNVEVYTNTSAQVRSRNSSSAAGSTLYIMTNGWIDKRGRLA